MGHNNRGNTYIGDASQERPESCSELLLYGGYLYFDAEEEV